LLKEAKAEPGSAEAGFFYPVNSMLYADQLLIIATAVRKLRDRGCLMRIETRGYLSEQFFQKEITDGRIRYAGRIDFFRLLELGPQFPGLENLTRRPGKDRFIELTRFDKDNYFEVGTRIIRIVATHARVDKAVQYMLDFCLFEIMDNVLTHAVYAEQVRAEGWCSAQYFPALKSVRLMIADTGIGIHRALTRHPDSKYRQLSASQALRQCVEKGVTNGKGQGFGLYATRQFAMHNKGELLIYSAEHYGILRQGQYRVCKGAYWQGTLVFLNIRTDITVDYKSFMGENECLADDFNFIYPDGQ